MRFKEIKEYHDAIADIFLFKQAFPKVNFRYYVQPTGPLATGLKMIDVTNSTNTWPMQMQGRKDGGAVVKLGEGTMFEKMEEWNNSPELQKQHPFLGTYMSKVFKELGEDIKDSELDIHIKSIKDSAGTKFLDFIESMKNKKAEDEII